MHAYFRFFTVIITLVVASFYSPEASAKESWVRITSKDKKVSCLFPHEPEKIETVSRKSPAGTIKTRRTKHETDEVLFVINATDLPKVALTFASDDKILGNAAEGVLSNHLGKELSQKRIEIGGQPAVVLEYEVPNYDDEDHPGYLGIAIALLVDGTLYVVNGIRTKKDPQAKALQQKLLGSIRVHK